MSPFASLVKTLGRGGLVWNLWIGFSLARFGVSLARDVFWYAGPFRKFAIALVVSHLFWTAWMFRPWAQGEEESWI